MANRITWAGHATVLVELDGMRVLTDPVLRGHIGPLTRIAAPVAPAVAAAIDVVVLSHLHADHVDVASLRRIGAATTIVAPRGSAAWLRRRVASDVRELAPGESIAAGPLRLSATDAVHDGRRPFGPTAEPIGLVIAGSRSVYFAGDTDLFADMQQLAGRVDVALLPVWGWGPRLGSGHLDPERAAAAAALIAPEIAIPIHWGTYALPRPLPRLADPAAPAREFADRVARLAPGVTVPRIDPGGQIPL